MKCGPLGTLNPLYFHIALAHGLIQGGPNKNGRTSIASPALSSLLTGLTTARNVQYPSSKSAYSVGGMNGQTPSKSSFECGPIIVLKK